MTRVERALASVPGGTRARVNLAERSALIIGSPASHALLAAVQQAGYGAAVVQDEDERRRRQHETELAWRVLLQRARYSHSAGILFPFTGTLLSPVLEGVAMALSSITVVSNANRLIRFKPATAVDAGARVKSVAADS